jgi:hypothetical protein
LKRTTTRANGKATGFLAFVVAGMGMTQAPSDCEFTIYFKDIEGKEYHVREVTKRDSVGPTFAPGVKNPWFPTQNSPTPSEAPQSSTSAFTQPVPVSFFWRYNVSLQRKNAVNKSSADDESFSVALCIDAKEESMLGKMLSNAIRPALCV